MRYFNFPLFNSVFICHFQHLWFLGKKRKRKRERKKTQILIFRWVFEFSLILIFERKSSRRPEEHTQGEVKPNNFLFPGFLSFIFMGKIPSNLYLAVTHGNWFKYRFHKRGVKHDKRSALSFPKWPLNGAVNSITCSKMHWLFVCKSVASTKWRRNVKKNNKVELLTQYTKSLETGSIRIIDGDGELSVKLLWFSRRAYQC